jgi:DNA-binding Lrp family transcriptional regulator
MVLPPVAGSLRFDAMTGRRASTPPRTTPSVVAAADVEADRPERRDRPIVPLDDVDRTIIDQLRHDGRLSVRELAERVGVGRATAYARLARLQADGVITGFTARIDRRRTGMTVTALVTLEIEQHSWRPVRDAVARIPQVEYVALTTGEFDILLLVRCPDVATLRDVVLVELQSMEQVRTTRTIFVLDETGAPG